MDTPESPTAYLEVKGCTLEREGIAYFPDAPTERGVKHIKELTALAKSGHPAYILFITQMKGVTALRPNDETHPAFGDALRKAREAGVHILAVDCVVDTAPNPDGTLSLSVTADRPIPVEL
jgi:sugar fermentation stimulation protein A